MNLKKSMNGSGVNGAAIKMTPRIFLGVMMALFVAESAWSHGRPPDPLWMAKIPKVPGLGNYVTNKAAAIQLGKALFWDTNVGSDGGACATCHYHAGADSRTKNQLAPGGTHDTEPTATTFQPLPSGADGGPNYRLTQADFPLWQFENPNDRKSKLIYHTDDVVGSSGIFRQLFVSVSETSPEDTCETQPDDIFHIGPYNTRQVTGRNAPSVINSAFNFRQFWDGRANNLFNGSSNWGDRDPDAGVWIVKNGKPLKKKIQLKNSASASQALAPPLDSTEMSCAGRRFPDIGHKLLMRAPLDTQTVDPEDSVLGKLASDTGKGLKGTYADLVKKAFAKRWWNGKGEFGQRLDGTPYSHMEANFSLFFGLAIQLYEDTLISDQTPFDGPRDKDNYPINFTAQERHGLQLFLDDHCFLCHLGPTLSSAANPEVYTSKTVKFHNVMDRGGFNEESGGTDSAKPMLDIGFAITSVTPIAYDPGIDYHDPWGNPLSFTQQYIDWLANRDDPMVDPVQVLACDFQYPFALDFPYNELMSDPNAKGKDCRGYKELSRIPTTAVANKELALPNGGKLSAAIAAAFKIPPLRNVELTGPYFHNGSTKSLEEVIEFYNRGGNNVGNPGHFETFVFPLGMTEQDKVDLLVFLKTLTDERVRWERAPFDHPSIQIPRGAKPEPSPLGPNLAADEYLEIPAVGKNGRNTAQGPLLPFDQLLKN
ncbi:MAG: conjugal transfer protein [Methylococcaceae bacterium]|nr:conjugal transfer protein [Methylococcaceae bacterium]